MKNFRLPVAIACAALLAGGLASAGEIYKWVDENGNVHYEDRPIGKTDMEHVDIASRNTDNAAVQARVDANRKARAVKEQVASEAPPEMSKEEVREEQAADVDADVVPDQVPLRPHQAHPVPRRHRKAGQGHQLHFQPLAERLPVLVVGERIPAEALPPSLQRGLPQEAPVHRHVREHGEPPLPIPLLSGRNQLQHEPGRRSTGQLERQMAEGGDVHVGTGMHQPQGGAPPEVPGLGVRVGHEVLEHRRQDRPTEWRRRLRPPLPDEAARPQHVLAGTGGAGGGDGAGLEQIEVPVVNARLYQNYPNPFNPSTTISFTVPGSSTSRQNVLLVIYDVRGALVRTIINGPMKGGRHEVQWDGGNNRGEPVASGVYFSKLRVGGFSGMKKMVLIR